MFYYYNQNNQSELYAQVDNTIRKIEDNDFSQKFSLSVLKDNERQYEYDIMNNLIQSSIPKYQQHGMQKISEVFGQQIGCNKVQDNQIDEDEEEDIFFSPSYSCSEITPNNYCLQSEQFSPMKSQNQNQVQYQENNLYEQPNIKQEEIKFLSDNSNQFLSNLFKEEYQYSQDQIFEDQILQQNSNDINTQQQSCFNPNPEFQFQFQLQLEPKNEYIEFNKIQECSDNNNILSNSTDDSYGKSYQKQIKIQVKEKRHSCRKVKKSKAKQVKPTNLIKNFGNGFTNYLMKNKEVLFKFIKSQIPTSTLSDQQKILKKLQQDYRQKLHSIGQLKKFWNIETFEGKIGRVFSYKFLNEDLIAYFSSKNHKYAYQLFHYRHALIKGLKNPEEFISLTI